nr:retrovirus-related Pol polyprotein from transposon TNT 1-94 [Tanacetum cinerariifolium]
QLEEAQAVKAQSWKLPVCYDDDDDEEGYDSLNDNIISELPSYSAVTPTEPVDSLSMGDEHLDTIPATESDKFIKSCIENLVPNPRIKCELDPLCAKRFRISTYVLRGSIYEKQKQSRLIIESVKNGPLIWPSIEENRVTRPKKYSELSAMEAIQADCDVKTTNIILQGLPPEVYALVRNHKVTKELWERIQLLMQGTSLMKYEIECKLYDEFDKFAYKKGETIRDLYFKFSLLLNDMNIYNMKLEQFQVNTKFLNTLPPEWSKFVTDVKLKGDDPIDVINHMMSFLTVVVTSHYPTTNNQTYTQGASGNNSRKQKTIIHNNCKREGHMSKQCTKQKRKRDDSWFKDKVLLVQAQANGQILHEKELTFLADPRIAKAQATQTIITHNAVYQADDLDAYDFDSDELHTAKVAHMENLSHYGSDALVEAHNHDNVNCNIINQAVQAMPSSEQSNIMNHSETEITSDSNIIPYSHEETLMLAEESRSKMLLKQKYPMMLEKKVNTTLVAYVVLNLLSQDFETLFVLQTELSAEQSFWSQNYVNSPQLTPSSRPTKVEVPKELPKVSMVNTSLKKLKHHLASFDMVVKERTTTTAITEGTLGFEHTKACFRDEIIPFVKALKDLFNSFDQFLVDELSEVQHVFHQIEQVVEQLHSQVKDVVIKTLKEGIKSLSGNMKEDKIKKELEDIETINIELDHKDVQIVPWYLDSGCSKHMTVDRSQLTNFVDKFLGTVKFGNEHVAKIMGYGDYQIGNVTISRVYFMEGLGHNLFSVGQFCDLDLEVAFRQHTCFIRNLEGVNLLTGSQGNNLYTLSLGDMMASSPICPLSKASKTKSWLWHQRLSHLNFGAINHLARKGLVWGLPKLKFEKDHLCSACAMGKSKKKSHKPKYEDTNQEKLYLLHMDLCRPMRVESVNGRKYIIVIVDDYSRFTWVKCLRSKDEAPDFIIKFLKMIQVGISHETYVARSPQQNSVVERRNHMLIEAVHTMLIYAKALLFLWAEAVATACYPQNRSIVRLRHGKTPYELLHNKLHDLSFFHVFGALCYPTNDSENLGKLQPKPDIAPEVNAPIAEVVAPEPTASTGSPSSTTVDQDAPSPSHS